MFSSEYQFLPMTAKDIEDVVAVIESTDEDDAECAYQCYKNKGIGDQFVLKHNSKIIGIIGYDYADDTNGTFWLSWTYLLEEYQGNGLGKQMLIDIIAKLKQVEARKLFVSISDYKDIDDGKIYENARRLYHAIGFSEEVRHQDYYAFNESETILGLRINETMQTEVVDIDNECIKLTGCFLIEETESTYGIDWKYSGNKMFSQKDMLKFVKKCEKKNAKKIYISFPSNSVLVFDALYDCGFTEIGKLKDYYTDGVDEVHFGYQFI